MTYLLDTEIQITIDSKQYKYIVSSKHRIPTPQKSQWVVPISEEIACFTFSISKDWKENTTGWGVKIGITNSLEIIGKNKTGKNGKSLPTMLT